MANFADVLNKPAAEVEKPKPYPVGTYHCLVDGPAAIEKVGKKQTDAAIFKYKILAPGPDVDPSALAEIPGGMAGKQLRHTMWLTEDSLYRLTQLLEDHMGIDKAGKTVGEMLAEAPGRQLMVTVGHRPSEDGQTLYSEVKSTARV